MAAEDPAAGTATEGAKEGSARSLRDLMRRTWEMELLISGAVVFALLQIPERLDAWFDLLDPHLSRGLGLLPFLAYTYLKLIIYTLVGTFVLHLAARGYWIGLIGLDSIFPQGIQWERLDAGPIARRLQRATLPTLRRLIGGADRFCSSIFSFAFVVVFIFGFSVVASVPVMAVAYFLAQQLFDERAVLPVFLAGWLVIFGPQLIFGLLDRIAGKRISPTGRLARLTRGVLAFYSRLTLLPLHGPILATFATNVRKSVVYPVFYGLLVAMMGLFLAKDVLGRRGALTFSSYVWVPDQAGPYGVEPRHYEDLAGGARGAGAVPTIQSLTATEPYLRLFLPYRPAADNEVVAELCEDRAPPSGEGLRISRRRAERPPDEGSETALECLARLFTVSLDGQAVAAPDYAFFRQPGGGQRGLLALLPIDGLAPGRHLLTVEKLRPRRDSDEPGAPRKRTYYIPFWR